MATCSVEGCSTRLLARGYCCKHYTAFRKYGDPLHRKNIKFVGLCKDCGECRSFYGRSTTCTICWRKKTTLWAENNPERQRQLSRTNALKSYQKLRAQVLHAYGGVCVCCGEKHPAFLALDHIDGGGRAHRRQIGGGGGPRLYRWIRDHGYPKNFQLLCHNCNFAKSNGGCPHARNTPVLP